MPPLQQEANPAAASDLLVGLSAARDLLLCAKPLFIGALVCLRRQPGMTHWSAGQDGRQRQLNA
jgi:hypothetical protein